MMAAELAKALGGRRHGREWKAKCPAHLDRTPSLAIKDSSSGRILIHCHAGCEQARVIDALRSLGLWEAGDDRPHLQIVDEQFNRDDEARKAMALDIWNTSVPAQNTPVASYLRSRGITLPPPASLRFYDALKHYPSGTTWPAMVALISDPDGKPLAVHRIYLALDGNGKAPVNPKKMTLASCRAGAVRLGAIEPGKSLAIAEGIETALSVMQACQFPTWAALSADGMRTVKLPPEAASVILCADNDTNGVGKTAAESALKRFLREGRSARIVMPPDAGTDFNDLLLKSKERKSHVG
jgi:putative DNA primase/helicase